MDLLKIYFDNNFNLVLVIGKLFFGLAILIPLIYYIYKKYLKQYIGNTYEINEAIIGIGNHKLTIRPNYSDMQIAYKLWVELSTRKIGLPIDFKHDLIMEIYNSWYDFFKITRDLIKEIPISKIRNQDSTKEIVRISIDVLNEGLRPHLTKWQAKFRRWYNSELSKEESNNLNPHEIQNKYPDISEIVKEMKEVNQKLIEYRKLLKKLAMDN